MAGCLHPITIRAPGRDAGIYSLYHYIQVPCGRCPECLKRRQQDWSIRIQHETRDCLDKGGSCYFLTITYDDDHLPRFEYFDESSGDFFGMTEPTLYYPHVQVFLNSLRKHFEDVGRIRFFCCGEYGDSLMRPHYHLMIWFDFYILAEDLLPVCKRLWKHGIEVTLSPFSVRRSEYIAKYSTKRLSQEYDHITPPFAKMSLKPAIGSCFIEKNRDFYRNNQMFHTYDTTGVPFALPRYYKNRIFDLDHIDNYSAQCVARYWALYDARSVFNPRYEIERRFNIQSYEENFFRKLRSVRLNVSVL